MNRLFQSYKSKLQRGQRAVSRGIRPVFSFLLALMMFFCLNFAPISLFTNYITGVVSAYQSSTSREYYTNRDAEDEKNMGEGTLPSHLSQMLSKYFPDSGRNFDLASYYETRFNAIFGEKVDEFLKASDKVLGGAEDTYGTRYQEFLAEYHGSIREYYDTNKTEINGNSEYTSNGVRDLVTFVEYLVTHEINYTNESNPKQLPPLFEDESYTGSARSKFYNAIANHFVEDEQEIESDASHYDGMDIDSGKIKDENFHTNSKSYLRFKEIVDGVIEKTIAIYAFDGLQNKKLAAIKAENAPWLNYYYYDDTYQTKDEMIDYAALYETVANGSESHATLYYFGTASETTVKNAYKAAHSDTTTDAYFISARSLSELQNSNEPLMYKKVTASDDADYVSGYELYYHYTTSPYISGRYGLQIYVADDEVTEDELSAYTFLGFEVIPTTEVNKDQATNKNYVQVELTDANIKYITGYSSGGLYYKNFKKLFASGDNSVLYLKYKSSTDRVIYTYDSSKSDSYTVIDKSSATYTPDDYKLLVSGDSGYVQGEELYYKKNKVYFTKTKNEDSRYQTSGSGNFVYEEHQNANNDALFEKIEVPSGTYYTHSQGDGQPQSRLMFVVVDDATYNSAQPDNVDNLLRYKNMDFGCGEKLTVALVTNEILERDSEYYVKLSKKESDSVNKGKSASSGEASPTDYELYYRQKAQSVRKIYIIDDEKDAADNKVYKNLHYTVITNDTYKQIADKYVAIESGDANYNSNFKLYYKFDETKLSSGVFVKNPLRQDSDSVSASTNPNSDNAIFVVYADASAADFEMFKSKQYTYLPNAEYEAEKSLYVPVTDEGVKDETYPYLYYKYNENYRDTSKERLIYIDKADKTDSMNYQTFDKNSASFNANDYDLIMPGEEGYTAGLNLYYKKVVKDEGAGTENEPVFTTYSFTCGGGSITLEPNSYYLISFYVYTNGTYFNGKDMEASIYATDNTNKAIDEVKLEHISTKGEWMKMDLYISSDAYSSSAITITLYMGDRDSILGSNKTAYLNAATSSEDGHIPGADEFNVYDQNQDIYTNAVSGVVLFDNIKVTKINMTDFVKHQIDGVSEIADNSKETSEQPSEPNEEPPTEPSEEPERNEDGREPAGQYTLFTESQDYGLDYYGNKVFAFDYNSHLYANSELEGYDGKKFEDIFNIDQFYGADDPFTSENLALAENADGFSEYSNLWQYYISRDMSGQGNNAKLNSLRSAYSKGDLQAALVSESEEKAKIEAESKQDEPQDSETNTDGEDEPEAEGVFSVDSTFRKNNKILKLKNKNRQLTLGVVSNYFTVKQNEYYKVTVWIYSAEEDAKAVIELFSTKLTSNSQTNGKLIISTAQVDAHISKYNVEDDEDSQASDEYGWIPVNIYIRGNSLSDMNCYLALCAEKSSTVYFDNITIEHSTSSAFNAAGNENLDYSLNLSSSDSVYENGITNGFFDSVEVSDNFQSVDYSVPRKASNWTVDTSTTGVITGVVPTSDTYLASSKNFYSEYASELINGSSFKEDSKFNIHPNNVYAVYLPSKIDSPLQGSAAKYDQSKGLKSTFKMHSSSMSLTSSSVLEVSYQFYSCSGFSGTLTSSLYYTSNSKNNTIAEISKQITAESDEHGAWHKVSFYVATGTSSLSSTYLSISVEDAVGVCFIGGAIFKPQSKSLDEIKTQMLSEAGKNVSPDAEGSTYDGTDLYSQLPYVRFVDVSARNFTVHGTELNKDTNTYSVEEYTADSAVTNKHTVGRTGVAIASYYSSETVPSYKVTVDKVEYYILEVKDGATGAISYKLFTDSNHKKEVSKVNEQYVINGKSVTFEGSSKIVLGKNDPVKSQEYDITKTDTVKHEYTFDSGKDYIFGNTIIPAEELNNAQSQNVLIIVNERDTDLTTLTSNFGATLSSSSYYAIKIYIKTGEFQNDAAKLKLNVSAVSREFKDIDTTKVSSSSKDKFGFVCYQVLVATGSSSISSASVTITLGEEGKSSKGYAIISSIEIQKFETEKLFNEYGENFSQNDPTVLRYTATAADSDSDSSSDDEKDKKIWSTFFYIFSSILLAIAIIIALVAAIVKRHPIKMPKVQQNEHDKSGFVDKDDTIDTGSKGGAAKATKSKGSSNDFGFTTDEAPTKPNKSNSASGDFGFTTDEAPTKSKKSNGAPSKSTKSNKSTKKPSNSKSNAKSDSKSDSEDTGIV